MEFVSQRTMEVEKRYIPQQRLQELVASGDVDFDCRDYGHTCAYSKKNKPHHGRYFNARSIYARASCDGGRGCWSDDNFKALIYCGLMTTCCRRSAADGQVLAPRPQFRFLSNRFLLGTNSCRLYAWKRKNTDGLSFILRESLFPNA